MFKKKLPYYLFFPLLIILIICIVFFIDKGFNLHLYRYGIYPRHYKGISGILFWNFIHADFKHLFNNVITLFVLTSLLFYYYKEYAWKLLFIGTLILGILTWLIGRESHHIGVSGVNYMLVSFLFFSGIISKHYRLMAVSLVVVLLYGSLIWLMFPIIDKISWEGHISGFFTGIIFAIYYRKQLKEKFKDERKIKISPEDEEFLNHFDEDGNFIENKPTDEAIIKENNTDI